MMTLVKVTCELDRLRKLRFEERNHLSDGDYWNLCRLALGAEQSMPRDEIVRRVAHLVDYMQARRQI